MHRHSGLSNSTTNVSSKLWTPLLLSSWETSSSGNRKSVQPGVASRADVTQVARRLNTAVVPVMLVTAAFPSSSVAYEIIAAVSMLFGLPLHFRRSCSLVCPCLV
eukprot:175673-Hanusia_phi.AAC.2